MYGTISVLFFAVRFEYAEKPEKTAAHFDRPKIRIINSFSYITRRITTDA
jgi:hypothetical protein